MGKQLIYLVGPQGSGKSDLVRRLDGVEIRFTTEPYMTLRQAAVKALKMWSRGSLETLIVTAQNHCKQDEKTIRKFATKKEYSFKLIKIEL